MRYLLDQKALFVHVPRTGGTFVQEALPLLGIKTSRWLKNALRIGIVRKHGTLLHLLPKRLSQVEFSFAFVRHPISYYESTWKWLDGAERLGRRIVTTRWSWHPFSSVARLWHPSFSVWLENVLNTEPAWVTRLFESYVGPEGGEWVNFVGRQENLLVDLLKVLHELGISVDVTRLGSMERRNAINRRLEWGRMQRHRVLESEQTTIRRFYKDAI